MIQLQLGHGVIKGCRDAVDWSPLESELAINAGPFPLVELINLLLWQAYEIPVSCLHNDMVMSKVLNPTVDDLFFCRGLVFKTESDLEKTDETAPPYNFDIKGVEVFFSADYP